MQTLRKENLVKQKSNTTVLVTGAGGFIGKVVVAELLHRGYPVIAMVRPQAIVSLPVDPNLSILRADITDYDSFVSQVRSANAIVHLAANKYNPKLAPKVNLQGAENLVRLITEKKIRGKRLINISTQSTKIKRKGVYGSTKAQSDRILEQDTIDWTTIKPSLVYGDEPGSLFTTIANYTRKLPFVPVIGNGKWELNPIEVGDVATAIIGALENDATIGKTYDLGGPKKVTFDQLIGIIQNTIGIKKPIVHIPMWFGYAVTWLAAKVISNLPITTDNILGSNQNTDCDPKPAMKDFRFQPIPVTDGVQKYLGSDSTKVRIAMVGLGKMGILHATVLSSLKNVQIVALVDRDRSLAVTAQSMGILAPAYATLEEAVKNHHIDGVYICTPNFTHAELMRQCAQHHLPFFIEKPVVTSIADLTDIMKNTDPKLTAQSAAGYFWIYRREIQYTKKLLEQHAIGDVTDYRVTLKHSEVFGPKKGWMFAKKLSGGGVLINPGPHAVSIITYLFGKPTVTSAVIKSLYGNDVEDEAAVAFAHKGITGELAASWSVKGYPVLTIEYAITGTDGVILFSDNTLTIKRNKKKAEIIPYTAIPATGEVFDLNPKAGGEGYYLEDVAFVRGLTEKPQSMNSLAFAYTVEQVIAESYEKAQ